MKTFTFSSQDLHSKTNAEIVNEIKPEAQDEKNIRIINFAKDDFKKFTSQVTAHFEEKAKNHTLTIADRFLLEESERLVSYYTRHKFFNE